MSDGQETVLTTGQAAELCCVKPDTVRKWIEKGWLQAQRTAGGHYRIGRQALAPFITTSRDLHRVAEEPRLRLPLHCWEYLNQQGVLAEECRSCVVYRIGASRCYEVATLDRKLGHARRFCRESCDACSYYRRAKGLVMNVLVVTSDVDFISFLREEKDRTEEVEFMFAQSACEASALIRRSPPAFVVVDHEIPELVNGSGGEPPRVKPDSIRKWGRKGRLKAVHTAGGRSRLSVEDLAPFLAAPPDQAPPLPEVPAAPYRPALRCWEYLSERGAIREACRRCVVHRMRAARCFTVADRACDIGHAKQFCQQSCDDCIYYRRVVGAAMNVLVISADEDFVGRVRRSEDKRIEVRFARNAYDASAIIQVFRPAFVVVDQEFLAREGGLPESLASELQVPGVKLILAVRRPTSSRRRKAYERLVDGELHRPFNMRRLAELANRFPVEPSVPEGARG